MPTPTHIFAELAATYGGVDPSDIVAVQRWYEDTLPTLPEATILEVLTELAGQEGVSDVADQTRVYPDKAPLPTLDQAPSVPLPLLAAGWREFFRRVMRWHWTGGKPSR